MSQPGPSTGADTQVPTAKAQSREDASDARATPNSSSGATSAGPVRRPHPYLFVIVFLSTYYVALLGPVLPALVAPSGGGALTIGVMFSCYALAQFLTAPALGALGDRYGRRTVLLCSMVGVITGFTIFTVGAVTGAGLWTLVLGWIVVGASDCWLSMAFSSAADTTDAAHRTRTFAYLTAAIGSAFIIGPATSAVFSGAGPAAPVVVLLVLVVLAAVWGWFAMPETLPHSSRATTLRLRRLNPASQIRDILQLRQIRTVLLAYLLFWPSVIVISSNLPTLMAERASFGPAQISTALIIWGVLVVLVQLAALPLLLRRFSEIRLAVVGAVLAGFSFLALASFALSGSTALLYTGVVLFGLGQPMVQTCLTGAMSKSVGSDRQGRVQGGVAATMALAQVGGPFAAGWLYASLTPSAPYWTIALLIGVSTALVVAAAPSLTQLHDASRAVDSTAGTAR